MDWPDAIEGGHTIDVTFLGVRDDVRYRKNAGNRFVGEADSVAPIGRLVRTVVHTSEADKEATRIHNEILAKVFAEAAAESEPPTSNTD